MEFCILHTTFPTPNLSRNQKHPPATGEIAAPKSRERVCREGRSVVFNMLKGHPCGVERRVFASFGLSWETLMPIQAVVSYAGDTAELETEETSVLDVEETSEPSSTFFPKSCIMQLRNCQKKERKWGGMFKQKVLRALHFSLIDPFTK